MTDLIKQYLKEVRNIPLLTAEQEIKLSRQAKAGDKKARQLMIKSNLRLVINIAKRYMHMGIPISDLIEEGNLGLMKAVEKFKPSKGYRFSTYAAWWIKQYITRALANYGKTIRIPVYMSELVLKFKKTQDELTQKFHRKPRVHETAKKMRIPINKVQMLNELSGNITSLNAPIGDDETSELMDILESENLAEETKEQLYFLMKDRIHDLMSSMKPRERKILTLRFGLGDGATHTLDETAKQFGITRERVRQIEANVLKKLKERIVAEENKLKKEILGKNK